jgi:hypothetical protein
MATSENVGSVSDTRLAAATEEMDQVSRLHRQGIAVRLNSPGAVRRHHRDANTYAVACYWRCVDGDRVLHEFLTSQRAKLIDRCRLDVARRTPMAKPAYAAAPARALPAPRARAGRVSVGLAKDIGFDYLTVRNIPGHLGLTCKDVWVSRDKTSQTVPKAMFKRIGSQTSRA